MMYDRWKLTTDVPEINPVLVYEINNRFNQVLSEAVAGEELPPRYMSILRMVWAGVSFEKLERMTGLKSENIATLFDQFGDKLYDRLVKEYNYMGGRRG